MGEVKTMGRTYSINSRLLHVALMLAAIAVVGCDLGTYESRRQQAAQNIDQRAKLGKLLGKEIAIPAGQENTGIAITLPRVLGESGKPLPPGFPPIPGVGGMFESDATGAGPQLLLGGVPMAEGPPERLAEMVGNMLRTISPGAQVSAGQENLQGAPNVHRITVVGEQLFLIAADANAPRVPSPRAGQTRGYIIPGRQHIGVLLFRAPDAENSDFWEAVDASVRTIRVN
jgi:hypothetical protein